MGGIVISKILEIIKYFLIGVLSVFMIPIVLTFIIIVIGAPVYLMNMYESVWWLLLYPLIAAIVISTNTEYLTREDNGEEMP